MPSKSPKFDLLRVILTIFVAFTPFFAHSEGGFWSRNQVQNLSFSEKSARSVFLITVPAGEVVEIDLKKYPSLAQAMASLKDNSSLVEIELELRKRAIEECFKEKLKICKILSDFELGTAFLVQDNQNLVTAFHVFRDQIGVRAKSALLVGVQDNSGNILFGSKDKEVAEVAFVHPEALKNAEKTSPILDFVQLKLSRTIVGDYGPLSVGEDTRLGDEDRIVSLGYPGPTFDRKITYGKPDSDGLSQLFTYGPKMNQAEYLRRTGKDINQINPELVQLLDAALLYVDSDSYFGMSGGPAINSQGQVIGIILGSYPVDGSASKNKSVVILRASWIQHLKTGK